MISDAVSVSEPQCTIASAQFAVTRQSAPAMHHVPHTVLSFLVARFKIGHTPRKFPDIPSATFRFLAYLWSALLNLYYYNTIPHKLQVFYGGFFILNCKFFVNKISCGYGSRPCIITPAIKYRYFFSWVSTPKLPPPQPLPEGRGYIWRVLRTLHPPKGYRLLNPLSTFNCRSNTYSQFTLR